MSNNKKTTFKQIWDKLRGVDISKLVVKKGKLDYLNWADAWVLIMDTYPEATYEFKPPVFYGIQGGSGTCEVYCSITIEGITREWGLPVMTNQLPMKSIENPTSRDISDAKARCLVKTLAIFGLGLSLWEKKQGSSVKVTEFADGVGF